MALSKKSLEQAKQVLADILYSHVDVIVTRAALDKRIELIKFPFLQRSHDRYQRNRTLYGSQQYDPIRYWLINNKFLTSSRNASGVYQYRVNRDIISAFLRLANDAIQYNNIKNKNKKVMTIKERVFQHIEANGNAMRYTDIIKFAYELNNGIGTFNKKSDRGYYSSAFTTYIDRYNRNKYHQGHFVKYNSNGYLFKCPNGLWAVCRPSKNTDCVPQEQYDAMCKHLSKYSITADQLDSLATDYFNKKDGDVNSCYHFAYNDLLDQAIKTLRKNIEEEIDDVVPFPSISEMLATKNHKTYIILYKTEERYISEGLFDAEEVESFFIHRNPKDYSVMEVGNMVTIEKSITTSVKIK